MYIRQYFSSLCTSEGLLGPGADPAFYPLTDPKIRKRVLVAHLVQSVQRRSEQFIGKPLGKLLFHGWIKDAVVIALKHPAYPNILSLTF